MVGGHPALDFANTVWWHDSDEPVEWLRSYEDLLRWALRADVISDHEADVLRGHAADSPTDAARVTGEAVELREALFRLFQATARDRKTDEGDLSILNRSLADALPHLTLDTRGRTFDWKWAGEALERPLWPVAWEAARLLVSPDLSRVGICAGAPCGWLFLDRSRNRSRRWCDMGDCGNRAKVRRHYERHKEKGPPT